MNSSKIINSPKISIIIAIYNSQDYIERCVRSLMEQTLDDLEYIFVNDGSTDDSMQILQHVCEQYSERKFQIKIISHDINRGVSISRQDGVDNACGEYIIHCDPDDWFNQNAMDRMYAEAKRSNCDILITDYFSDTGNSSSIVNQCPNSLNPNDLINQLFTNLHGSLWNKLVRTEFIKKVKVKFNPSLSFCEDLSYNIELLAKNPTVSYLNQAFYHYLYNQNQHSLTRKYSFEVYERDQKLLSYIMKIVPDNIKEKAYNKIVCILTWRSFISGYFSAPEYKKKFKSYLFPLLKSKTSLKIKILLFVSLCISYKEARNVYVEYKNKT